MTKLVLRTLTCRGCGMDWERPRVRGNLPARCPDCRTVRRSAPPRRSGARLDTNTAGYRVALAVTTYRLAIEEASCALRLGKPADALAALEAVQAPARSMDKNRPRVPRTIALPDGA